MHLLLHKVGKNRCEGDWNIFSHLPFVNGVHSLGGYDDFTIG